MGGLVTVASEWRVMQRATVALLDEQFADRVCRVSGLTAALHSSACAGSRSTPRSRRCAVLSPACCCCYGIRRIGGGASRRKASTLPLKLTHGFPSSLVCMRRPSVSAAALVALARDGALRRNADRTWLLMGDRRGSTASTCQLRGRHADRLPHRAHRVALL